MAATFLLTAIELTDQITARSQTVFTPRDWKWDIFHTFYQFRNSDNLANLRFFHRSAIYVSLTQTHPSSSSCLLFHSFPKSKSSASMASWSPLWFDRWDAPLSPWLIATDDKINVVWLWHWEERNVSDLQTRVIWPRHTKKKKIFYRMIGPCNRRFKWDELECWVKVSREMDPVLLQLLWLIKADQASMFLQYDLFRSEMFWLGFVGEVVGGSQWYLNQKMLFFLLAREFLLSVPFIQKCTTSCRVIVCRASLLSTESC